MDLARLAAAGFDITHGLDVAALAREPGLGVLAGAHRRGILIGNTRALWPIFLAARRADPALAAADDPLDAYTEREVMAAAPGARCFFAHRRYDGVFLPFQRLAAAARLATLAPIQLLIHPIYGPWFAVRAAVLLDGDPVTAPPLTPPCICDTACRAAFEHARSAEGWQAWLAVRDACHIGRAYRYDEDQLAYHYTKARELLR